MNEDKQIEQERYDMAKIMADNFHINGEKWDDSDFEWTAHCLQMEGYHKQSEWISVDERLPEESGYYLTYNAFGNRTILPYSTRHKRFNCWDCLKKNRVDDYSINVTHWMPLPEVPKGGE